MKTQFSSAILALCFAANAAFAADSSPAPTAATPRDTTLERASAANAQKDWAGAQSILREALVRDPGNADYHNMYAYSMRKSANPDMSLVFKHYNQALSINSTHRGAHEYIGEAYLMVGNVGKAKEHLSQLDKICIFGCSEYRDLKKAVADYETKNASR